MSNIVFLSADTYIAFIRDELCIPTAALEKFSPFWAPELNNLNSSVDFLLEIRYKEDNINLAGLAEVREICLRH